MSNHSSELVKLLTFLKEERKVSIQDTHPGPRIKYVLDINGEEQRPYSNEELKLLIKYYEPFKDNLKEQKLWPVKKLK